MLAVKRSAMLPAAAPGQRIGLHASGLPLVTPPRQLHQPRKAVARNVRRMPMAVRAAAGQREPPPPPPMPSTRRFNRSIWTAVDVAALLGSVGGALAALLGWVSPTYALALPLVLPIVSLVAALQREDVSSEANRQYLSSLSSSQSDTQKLLAEARGAIDDVRREVKTAGSVAGRITGLEGRLATLEASLIGTSRNARDAALGVTALSQQLAAQQQQSQEALLSALRGELRRSAEGRGSESLASFARLDTRLVAVEGSLAGLEAAQGDGFRRLSSTVAGALAESEASLQASLCSQLSRGLEPVRRLPQQLAAAPVEVAEAQPAPGGAPAAQLSDGRLMQQLRAMVAEEVQAAATQLLDSQADLAGRLAAPPRPTPMEEEQWEALGRRLARLERLIEDVPQLGEQAVAAQLTPIAEQLPGARMAAEDAAAQLQELRQLLDPAATSAAAAAGVQEATQQLLGGLEALQQSSTVMQERLAALQDAAGFAGDAPGSGAPSLFSSIAAVDERVADAVAVLHQLQRDQEALLGTGGAAPAYGSAHAAEPGAAMAAAGPGDVEDVQAVAQQLRAVSAELAEQLAALRADVSTAVAAQLTPVAISSELAAAATAAAALGADVSAPAAEPGQAGSGGAPVASRPGGALAADLADRVGGRVSEEVGALRQELLEQMQGLERRLAEAAAAAAAAAAAIGAGATIADAAAVGVAASAAEDASGFEDWLRGKQAALESAPESAAAAAPAQLGAQQPSSGIRVPDVGSGYLAMAAAAAGDAVDAYAGPGYSRDAGPQAQQPLPGLPPYPGAAEPGGDAAYQQPGYGGGMQQEPYDYQQQPYDYYGDQQQYDSGTGQGQQPGATLYGGPPQPEQPYGSEAAYDEWQQPQQLAAQDQQQEQQQPLVEPSAVQQEAAAAQARLQQQQQPGLPGLPDIAAMPPDQLLPEGLKLLRAGRQELRQALDYGLADALLQRAVLAFSRAADESGGADVKALGNLGNALLALGELKGALLAELAASASDSTPAEQDSLDMAQLKLRSEASTLLTRAGEMFRSVLEREGWSSRALLNWGVALTQRAVLAQLPEAVGKLYTAAIDKFEAVLEEEPDMVLAQYRCALALQGLAAVKPAGGSEQLQLLGDASNYLQDVVNSSSEDADEALKAAAADALKAVGEQLELAKLR